jgi:hypothetical protein
MRIHNRKFHIYLNEYLLSEKSNSLLIVLESVRGLYEGDVREDGLTAKGVVDTNNGRFGTGAKREKKRRKLSREVCCLFLPLLLFSFFLFSLSFSLPLRFSLSLSLSLLLRIAHESRLDLRSADTMSSLVDDVIHSAGDPVVPVLVANDTVAGEVVALVLREVRTREREATVKRRRRVLLLSLCVSLCSLLAYLSLLSLSLNFLSKTRIVSRVSSVSLSSYARYLG